MATDWFARFRQHDRQALARLLTWASRGEHLDLLARQLSPPVRPSRVVAFTGSGGVGKSSLIGRSLGWLRKHQHTVAVLACDPQSPYSGGALLGDRFRMGQADDEGVFIRSLAALSGQQAVAGHLDWMIRLVEAFGFDTILLETVGAGQGDVAVRNLADVVVLLVQPEMGDDLQWEKAGVLEMADVVVVHKADLPGADQTAAQLRAVLDLGGSRETPIVRVSTRQNQGFDELWRLIQERPLRRGFEEQVQQDLLRLAQETLAARFPALVQTQGERLQQLWSAWRTGAMTSESAGGEVFEMARARREGSG